MSDVTIIDYGIGNVLSVKRAFEAVGAVVDFASCADDIMTAKRLVLPGVGAFKKGMEALSERNLITAIKAYCDENRPFLGICLGMQMMLDSSEEFGHSDGLGIIHGCVKRLPSVNEKGEAIKVPQVGWNSVNYINIKDNSIMDNCSDNDCFYFVHSYTAFPTDEKNRLADSYYCGCRVAAAINQGKVYGLQFHPEKSGEEGLKIIKRFVELEP